jgi:hypothetical protein
MSSAASGSTAMTVRADDLALRDLVENAPPVAVAKALTNREELLALVVELQHHGIRLPAVQTRVRAEVFDQVRGPFEREVLLPPSGILDVPLSIGDIVLVLVVRSARPAVVVALPQAFTAPVEFLDRSEPAAPAAPAHRSCFGSFAHDRTYVRPLLGWNECVPELVPA